MTITPEQLTKIQTEAAQAGKDMVDFFEINQELRLKIKDLLDDLETAARYLCHTSNATRDHNGQVANTLVTDSTAISGHAQILRTLAQENRFRIVAEQGRMVIGYWPENDPDQKKEP